MISIKALFPQGEYWERQLQNADSDISLWIKAHAEQVYQYKKLFSNILQEASPKTAYKTIENWERVLIGIINSTLSIEERRKVLMTRKKGFVNQSVLDGIASIFSAKIIRMYVPYRSAFFAHTRIGTNRMCSPTSFSLLYIHVHITDNERKSEFESTLCATLLANNIVKFFYN